MSSASSIIIAINRDIEIPKEVKAVLDTADKIQTIDIGAYYTFEYPHWPCIGSSDKRREIVFDFIYDDLEEGDYAYIESGDNDFSEQGGDLEKYQLEKETILSGPLDNEDEATELLKECVKAFNYLTNQRIGGDNTKYRDTYAIASAIDNFLRKQNA